MRTLLDPHPQHRLVAPIWLVVQLGIQKQLLKRWHWQRLGVLVEYLTSERMILRDHNNRQLVTRSLDGQ